MNFMGILGDNPTSNSAKQQFAMEPMSYHPGEHWR